MKDSEALTGKAELISQRQELAVKKEPLDERMHIDMTTSTLNVFHNISNLDRTARTGGYRLYH